MNYVALLWRLILIPMQSVGKSSRPMCDCGKIERKLLVLAENPLVYASTRAPVQSPTTY